MISSDMQPDRDDRPFISVVLPVYNDPAGLEQTLDSLVDQTYPADRHEVIVVDNGSTDETQAVAHDFCSQHENVKLVVESTIQGSYAARNRGIRNTTGSILAFIDADMTVSADWLVRIADAMDDIEYLACGVQLHTDGPETVASKFNRLTGFNVDRYITELDFAPTCCLVVRTAVFDDVGLFDSRLISSGDLEFGNRVHESGRSLQYRPDIQMYHPTRDSISALLRKSVRIGQGRQQLRKFYPERYGSPLLGLLQPGIYLPPLPWRFSNQFREWESLSAAEKVSFYVIATLAGVARAYGRFSEAVTASVKGGWSDGARIDEQETVD